MHVVIHSKNGCPHCVAVQAYLEGLSIPVEIVKRDRKRDRDRLYDRLGLEGSKRTMPQVFLCVDGDTHHLGDRTATEASGIASLVGSV